MTASQSLNRRQRQNKLSGVWYRLAASLIVLITAVAVFPAIEAFADQPADSKDMHESQAALSRAGCEDETATEQGSAQSDLRDPRRAKRLMVLAAGGQWSRAREQEWSIFMKKPTAKLLSANDGKPRLTAAPDADFSCRSCASPSSFQNLSIKV